MVSNEINNLSLENKLVQGNELVKPCQGGGRNKNRKANNNTNLIDTQVPVEKKDNLNLDDLDDLLVTNVNDIPQSGGELDDLLGSSSDHNSLNNLGFSNNVQNNKGNLDDILDF